MYEVTDKIAIELKYAGSDVDDGSMSVEDMIPALQGFSSAYGKIVNSDEVQVKHTLRVVGVKKGSFDILLEVVARVAEGLQSNPDLVAGTLGYLAIDKIIGVIKISKHVKNQPYDTRINTNNGTINIINIDKLSLEMPHDVYRLFDEKILRQDINKIVKPLEEGKIDSTEITVKGGEGEIKETIVAGEKKYFNVEQVEVTKTESVEIEGVLNSLTKTTNKGYFILNNGDRVTYQFAGEKPELLYKHFLHKGVVRVKCIAHLDENLKPTLLDISEVTTLQRSIFESEDSEDKGA